MSSSSDRRFEDFDAASVTCRLPLIIGITAPSGAGKTYSALELATGIQEVVGGDIFGVDTESGRMLHYSRIFKFRHVPFLPPHSPEAYEQAVDYCVGRGARIIVLDSMSHEHNGEGGVLDQIDEFLDRKAGGDFNKRDKLKWAAQIEPKAQRRRLNRKIIGLGDRVIFVLCYRANDVTKPGEGGKPVHVGWKPETTSNLPYDMTLRFLLPPGADGRPDLNPETAWEKALTKIPAQFRDWYKPGLQLNRAIGRKLAEWHLNSTSTAAPTRCNAFQQNEIRELVKQLGWKTPDWAAFASDLGIAKLAEATPEQADLAIKGLRELLSPPSREPGEDDEPADRGDEPSPEEMARQTADGNTEAAA